MPMLDACERLLLLLVTDSTSGGGIMVGVLMPLVGGGILLLVQIICACGWLMVDSSVYACFCVVCEYFVLVLLFQISISCRFAVKL